jgi:carbamoyl-phosphate synthase large subunit
MIMLEGKRIFVSGGNGVIGNALIDRLHRQGAVLFVGDLKPRPLQWPGTIRYRQGDLNFITKAELDQFGPEFFFHLAATFERTTETYAFWDENRRHNLGLSTHLMSLLKDSTTLKKVVFASSYLVYNQAVYMSHVPAQAPVRLKESDPIMPRNLTGAAKLNHEIELGFLQEFRKNQYDVVAARIFRSYGKYSRDVISRWVRALLRDEEIVLYGKEGLFDYIFAEDVAEGLIRLACSPGATGVVNLGRGRARHVKDVVEILKKHFPAMKARDAERDIPYEASEADMARCEQITGWAPAEDLETAIPKLIEYEKGAMDGEGNSVPAFNVLVTSISKKIPLLKAVRKAVRKLGSETTLIGGDSDPGALGRHFVDMFWNMPRTEEENRKEIIDYVTRNNIRAIIPTRDGELRFWSNLKNDLPETNIVTGDPQSVELCLDKLLFYRELQKHGLPAIETTEHISELAPVEKVVVKERFGSGSVDMLLNASNDAAVAHAAKLSKPVFQPFVEGTEYSVDVYVCKTGKAKGGIARRRDVVVGGESHVTTTVDAPDLTALGICVAETLHVYGHVVLQVIQQGSGYHIVECNSRFGGASTLSVSSGLDSFYWSLLESIGTDISEYPFLPDPAPRRQIRFPEDLILE